MANVISETFYDADIRSKSGHLILFAKNFKTEKDAVFWAKSHLKGSEERYEIILVQRRIITKGRI